MIEARDRLVREEDPSTPFSNRRSGEGIWRDLGVVPTTTTERPFYRFSAGGSERNLFGSPLPVRNASRSPTTMGGIQASRLGSNNGGRGGGGGGRNLNGSPMVGLQNIAPLGSNRRGGRGRARNTPLPSWYPRAPLQDITAVVNAIERRRNRLRDAGSHMLGSPTPLELNILVDDPVAPPLEHDISLATPNPTAIELNILVNDPVAPPLEHDISLATPNPTAIIKHCPPAAGHLSKALFTKQNTDDTDFMTPQKKLLNAIDVVEKVVMEEFRRIQRTPNAKKAERERKVRTLMAMR